MNESHLPRVLGTNSHAKFSPNEGVIDEICNILKVLSIVLTERKKKKTNLECRGHGHCWVPTQLPTLSPTLLKHSPSSRGHSFREVDSTRTSSGGPD